jgi:protein-S-isoprenylcysteine O-methyltransferase Ste14
MTSRVVAVALFGLFTAGTVAHLATVTGDLASEPSLHAALVAGHWSLKLVVVAAFTYFIAVREPSRRPSRDPWALIACSAAIAAGVALRPPPDSASPALLIAGEAITVASVAWLVFSVLALGRCFGILPEARGLVTRGPYRLVRHPVYLGELAACGGLTLAAPSLFNVACFAVLCAAQRVRMGMEERALEREFPEYGAYAARTPRLIPWTAGMRPTPPSTAPASELGAS